MRQSDATFALCPLAFPSKTWRAFVVRVVDGDTVVLRIDLAREIVTEIFGHPAMIKLARHTLSHELAYVLRTIRTIT